MRRRHWSPAMYGMGWLGAGAEAIPVTFVDQTGAKTVQARVSPDIPVSKILPSIITKMMLPVTAPDGTPMSYSLDYKEGGIRLQDTQTLGQAGVRPGDHLIVYPEIVAGLELFGPDYGPYMGGLGLHTEAEQEEAMVFIDRAYGFAWEDFERGSKEGFNYNVGYLDAIHDLARAEGAAELAREAKAASDELKRAEKGRVGW